MKRVKELSYTQNQDMIDLAISQTQTLVKSVLSDAEMREIAKWPDEKYDRMIAYMRENLDPIDIEYIEWKRIIMREHGETFSGPAAFTLIKR
tara:strand:+ start:958 stop:1233 length:276 start_codon:yes stop_codon:yes gene_type:complete